LYRKEIFMTVQDIEKHQHREGKGWERVKIAAVEHPVHPLIERRFSPRAFAPEPVSEADLSSLFEAVRWAPSSRNAQPWSFVYAHRTDEEAFSRILESLSEGNRGWARDAAVLVAAFAQVADASPGGQTYAWHDLGIATGFLLVQATALDLYVHVMGGLDKAQMAESLSAPSGWQCVTALAIGHLGDIAHLPPDLAQRETAPRTRKEQAEFVFKGHFRG
jgi:nitroreductase